MEHIVLKTALLVGMAGNVTHKRANVFALLDLTGLTAKQVNIRVT